MKSDKIRLWAALALGFAGGCPVASAQDADLDQLKLDSAPAASAAPANTAPAPASGASPRASADRNRIEEVIVTAQRMQQDAQDVPISLTVFNPKQLENANVSSANDLANYTPSLSTNTRFGSDNATFAIRGFTQDLRTTASVGVYFAEVIAPRGQYIQASGDGAGPGELFDIDNVQVIKGPQGTLFGRNSTGGAVLIVPKRPTDQFEGYGEFSGGSFGANHAQAVINIPVASWFKVRFGIDHNDRDGYLLNNSRVGADHFGNLDYTAGRLSLLLNLTDDIENYTILSDVYSRNNGSPGKVFACNTGVTPTAIYVPGDCEKQVQAQTGYYDTNSTITTPISLIRTLRAINTTRWQIDDDLSIKNVFSYSHLHTLAGQDVFGFGTDFHMVEDVDPNRDFKLGISVKNPDVPATSQASYVEEVQLQGYSFEHKLEWQGGVYYERSMPDGYSGNTSASFVSCQMSSLEGPPSGYNCFDPLAGVLGSVQVFHVETNYFNKALYAQASYNFTDYLSVTGGVRYTWDKTAGYGQLTRYTFVGTVQSPAPANDMQTPETSSQAPTGLAEISYKPIPEVMTYAKYSRGYRQGSVNVATDPGVNTWKPEYVNAYEIGAKSTFGGWIPGRFNVALFYNDFNNQQLQAGYISTNYGPTTAIFNAGKSRIEGAEADFNLRLTQGLTANLSYSHLQTKLLQQANEKAAVLAAAGPVAEATYTATTEQGESLPYAPINTYVGSLNYRIELGDRWGIVDFGPTYSFIGKQRAAASSATPYAVLDSRALLNLSANWTAVFGTSLDFSIYATNVLNEKYIAYISGVYNSLGFESGQVGQPFMLGGRLKYSF